MIDQRAREEGKAAAGAKWSGGPLGPRATGSTMATPTDREKAAAAAEKYPTRFRLISFSPGENYFNFSREN